ncbi:transketolase [Candidatus Roizmanbacteria bacterium]|nr:transketolase [Candidatus Roizmanbacteria bacterium]
MVPFTEITKLLRSSILTSTTKAGTGHPTSALSAVELMAHLFFDGHFLHDFEREDNLFNDRVIFSKGHAVPLLYSLLAVAGILSPEELSTLRKIDSRLEGHPVPPMPGIDVATGSLGQGLSVAIGMALGQRLQMNQLQIDMQRKPRVYVLMGDSEVAEGQVWEAAQLASYYQLSTIVGILDVNRLGQRGETMLGWDVETYQKRFESFGWNTIVINDGNSESDVQNAFSQLEALLLNTTRPTILIAKTKKGAGISFLEDKENWHGKALPPELLEQAIREIGELSPGLIVPLTKPESYRSCTAPAVDWTTIQYTKYPSDSLIATREAYGNALVKIGEINPRLVVLDAELANSTGTEQFQNHFPERFFEIFIAEQNMVSVALGFSKLGFLPFIATFAAFFTRAFDQIRMAQYSHGTIKLAGSHAGVSIGPDGSSQMGLEDISMMRSILKSTVYYPADPFQTEKLVVESAKQDGLFYIRTTREKTPVIYNLNDEFPSGKIKIVHSSPQDTGVIFAAGITLHQTRKAYQHLREKNIFVTVADVYSVKPFSPEEIKTLVEHKEFVMVVEDHYPYGGIGEALQTALRPYLGRFIHLAVHKIPHSGSSEDLMQFEEIDANAIVQAVLP